MFKIIKCACIISVGLILTGFSLSPVIVRSATEKDDAQAKLFEPDATRALVYVFRDNSFLGKSGKSQLVINKVAVTKNEGSQFSVVSLAPGDYDFSSHSAGESNVAANLIHNKTKAALHFTVEPGKIYYFQEVFKSMGGFILTAVPEEEAKPKIKKCKLVAIHQL